MHLLVTEPGDEAAHVAGCDLAAPPPKPLPEKRIRGALEVGPVFLSGFFAEAVAAAALVAVDPIVGVLAEGDPAELLELAACNVRLARGLEPPCLVERARALPALPVSRVAVREDV